MGWNDDLVGTGVGGWSVKPVSQGDGQGTIPTAC